MQPAERYSLTGLRSRHAVEHQRETEGGSHQTRSSDKTATDKQTNKPWSSCLRDHRRLQTYRRHLRTTKRERVYILLWVSAYVIGMQLLRSSGEGTRLSETRERPSVVLWNDHPAEAKSYFRLPVTSFTRELSTAEARGDPDLGDLVLQTPHDDGKEIQIFPTDYDRAQEQRDNFLVGIDGSIEDSYLPESSKADGLEVSYPSHGYYRDAFRYRRQTPSNPDHFVMKKMRVKRSLGVRAISRVEREAVIMERFTRSPHILDIYSHCGFTVLVEAMKSEIYDEIVPQEYIKQTELDKLQVEDVHPFNKLTVSEKLQIAIYMAESLADLHGHEGGLIVHGDVYIEQWLLAPDGSLKLNDFSDSLRAEWHEKKQKYCFDNEKSGSKTWRSPEEYEGSLQDDRSDVYIFGNCIYALLTGLLPFYNEAATFGEDDKVRREIVEGKRPFVDARYRTRSFIETKLVEIMEQCWTTKDKRVSIFNVVASLLDLKRTAATMGIFETSSSVIKMPMLS